jgi:23S rRNA pseudouridine1911/1915/1917 synthase
MSSAQSEPDPARRERRLLLGATEAGERLDAVVAARLGIGRRAATRLLERARHNGRPARKGDRAAVGDELMLPEPGATDGAIDATPRIVRLTEDVAVLDKPAGLASVALAGSDAPSVAAWLAREVPGCSGVGAAGESGLVHRLDTGTSGILLAARNAAAHASLRAQFDRREVEKTYLAIVHGLAPESLTVSADIGQHPKSRRRMRALSGTDPDGRYWRSPASTRVDLLERLGSTSLVRATTRSGVRHQIRVHLAHAGYPLVGDALYGGATFAGIDGHLLHAETIAWCDASTGSRLVDRVPEPAAWSELRRSLRGS